jgi:hypothetical protein
MGDSGERLEHGLAGGLGATQNVSAFESGRDALGFDLRGRQEPTAGAGMDHGQEGRWEAAARVGVD